MEKNCNVGQALNLQRAERVVFLVLALHKMSERPGLPKFAESMAFFSLCGRHACCCRKAVVMLLKWCVGLPPISSPVFDWPHGSLEIPK